MQSWIHVIEWRANVRPDVTALADDRGATYTYSQLLAEVERKAGGWAGLGVGSGDVVAIVAKNSADFLVHAFALMRTGVTPAFVNWRLSSRELTEVLTLLEPKAIAADAEFTQLVDAAWPHTIPRVTIGGAPVRPADADGGTLAGPVPPRPVLTGGGQRGCRGRGWHRGQLNDDRFMNGSRRTGVPQRAHGRPSWPYASSERSK